MSKQVPQEPWVRIMSSEETFFLFSIQIYSLIWVTSIEKYPTVMRDMQYSFNKLTLGSSSSFCTEITNFIDFLNMDVVSFNGEFENFKICQHLLEVFHCNILRNSPHPPIHSPLQKTGTRSIKITSKKLFSLLYKYKCLSQSIVRIRKTIIPRY